MSLAKRNSEAAAKWAAKRRESKERAVILQEQARAAAAIPRQRPISSQNDEPPPRFGASTSHVDNAKYMDDFREGLANMRLALEGPGGAGDDELGVPNERRIPNERRDRSSYPSAPHGCRNSSSSSTTLTRCSSQHGESAPDRIRHRQSEQQRGGFGKVRSGAGLLAEELHRYVNGDAAVGGWREGPLDPAGNLLDLTDRNVLCASVQGDEAVFGCADHALYCVDLLRGVKTRQLYGSRSNPDAGHKEWVSAVCHTADGDIASGGMDGKLCVWPRGGGHPGEIQAHTGSISAMKADTEGRVVTSGYGGALRLWDCRGGGRGGAPPRMSGEMSDRGLPAPCMGFAWSGGRAMTGHRDGRVGIFDIETGAIVNGGCKGGAHRGHVTAIKALGNNVEGGAAAAGGGGSGPDCSCFVTGGQDGFVRIWDSRAGEVETGGERRREGGDGPAMVMEAPAHRGPIGVGAVGDVIVAGTRGNRLVSFGADKRVCVLEMRGGRGGGGGAAWMGNVDSSSSSSRARRPDAGTSSTFAIEHVFDDHRDFIYCMDFVPAGSRGGGGGGDGILITGGGDGMLLAHDLASMRLLYGLGCCSAGAVRCAVAGENRLTVAGDDGNAMLYAFGEATTAAVTGERQWRAK